MGGLPPGLGAGVGRPGYIVDHEHGPHKIAAVHAVAVFARLLKVLGIQLLEFLGHLVGNAVQRGEHQIIVPQLHFHRLALIDDGEILQVLAEPQQLLGGRHAAGGEGAHFDFEQAEEGGLLRQLHHAVLLQLGLAVGGGILLPAFNAGVVALGPFVKLLFLQDAVAAGGLGEDVVEPLLTAVGVLGRAHQHQ